MGVWQWSGLSGGSLLFVMKWRRNFEGKVLVALYTAKKGGGGGGGFFPLFPIISSLSFPGYKPKRHFPPAIILLSFFFF